MFEIFFDLSGVWWYSKPETFDIQRPEPATSILSVKWNKGKIFQQLKVSDEMWSLQLNKNSSRFIALSNSNQVDLCCFPAEIVNEQDVIHFNFA